MNNQELIVVKQLPVIEEELKKVTEEIDLKVKNVKSLVCTEENKQAIKKLRTEMKKEFEAFETKRKNIKTQVFAPWTRFDETYKECISDKYKEADKEFKEKIEAIEVEQKKKLEDEARSYFEKYKESKNIDFVTFENMNLKIGLSDNPTKLKKLVTAFLDKVSDDLNLIELQEYKAEILVEYKKSLNVSQAITIVLNRIEAVKKEQEKQEQKATHIEMNINHEIVQKEKKSVDEVFNKEQEKTYKITFTATGTALRLKQLKDYLLREGYQYE